MQWIEFPDPRLPVYGLPFFPENTPDLWRLPKSRESEYRPPVWSLGRCPTGGRIRFATDAGELAIRLDYGEVGHMNNMCRIGQHAVDCYVGKTYWSNAAPLEGEPQMEKVLFTGVAADQRQVTLYLPLYHPVKVLAVGLADDASLAPPAPYALDRPLVFYGSSVTQGGCASRSGTSYQAFLCRRLDLDHVNLGFSGNGRGEPEVARTLRDIDACGFVIDYAQNCPTVEELSDTYAPLLATIRERHPDAPILCVTPIGAAAEAWNQGHLDRLEEMRQVVRDAVGARREQGDRCIDLIEGWAVLGPEQMDGIVDVSHPNDLGFWHMANGLEPPVRNMLGL